MPQQVTMGAMLQCSFGVAPSTLAVLPLNRVLCEGPPAANIMDHIPLVNILPFGMCTHGIGVGTPSAAATTTPWVPGAVTVLLGNQPSLDNVSTCTCMWGGVVTIVDPATVKTQVP
jgi:hypothetical protein